MTLPIHAVLSDLLAALHGSPNAVLVAPPGAGKTTAVAPALLDQPWCDGRILLLSPRRLAARAAAERIAELLDSPVGDLVGYATRMDSRQSAKTRILVVTEGIFRNQIQADPELRGISAVLFDEVHERSLDSDFGLALALDAQAGLRPDLRLVAMSATLDGARFAAMLNGPVIESAGKMFPLTLRHIGRRAEARIEDEMAAAIRRALAEEPGDVLAFLPGVGEIERTRERLAGVEAEIFALHGSLDPKDQRAALRPAARRKIILATSIAETSLTIDGVRIVVDSGLARRARYDRAAGLARLVTERVSQAAATQRAGRAARQQPGIAYRLWEEGATSGLMPFDPPEILEADLSPLLLDCLIWGVRDPHSLNWLDAPPTAALAEAWARLRDWGAVDAEDRPTPHGRAMARLPLPPRLAHMLLTATAAGAADLAAQAAVLLSERGLGGNDTDLDQRLTRWQRESGQRAEAARGLARRWAKQAQTLVTAKGDRADLSLDIIIALGFPDRVAKRRDAKGENWISTGGRGFRLDPTSPLARADWLAVADIQGAASGARILSAVPTDQARIEALFADQIKQGARLDFDPATGGVRAESGRHLGAITLSKGQDSKVSSEEIAAALVEGVRTHGLEVLPWPEAALRLRTRARWAGLDTLEDAALLDQLDMWLAPLVAGKRRLGDIDDGALVQALKNLLGWDAQQSLDRLAPASFTSPAGTTHAIDYGAEAGPTVELRVQALFGLADHPVIGPDRTPLVLSLTSPAGRPIQTTRDLPGFWAGSWRDVAKEMRGAYPKHNWPDDPASATASLKTKKAQARG